MSAIIFGRVWELDLPWREKYVLLALADHSDHEGDNIFPSIGLIAWKTGYTERQVQRLLRKLEAQRILIRVADGGAGPRSTTHYRIELSAGIFREPRKRNAASGKGDNSQPKRVTFPAAKGDIAVSPESIKQPKAVTFPQKSPSGEPEIVQHPASANDSAADFHKSVERYLQGRGYSVAREVPVPDRGDGSPGRIDLTARGFGEVIALELDRERPRYKSRIKLIDFPASKRLIVLREPAVGFQQTPTLEAQIHAPCGRCGGTGMRPSYSTPRRTEACECREPN